LFSPDSTVTVWLPHEQQDKIAGELPHIFSRFACVSCVKLLAKFGNDRYWTLVQHQMERLNRDGLS
jgi:hypothetical protein